jgi:hypothetical protein
VRLLVTSPPEGAKFDDIRATTYDSAHRPFSMVGKTFAHYVVLERAGAGGMGVVFRARDATLTSNPNWYVTMLRTEGGFVNVDSPGRRGQGQKILRAQPVFSLLRPLTEP